MGGYTLNNMLEAAIVVRYQTLENYRNQKKQSITKVKTINKLQKSCYQKYTNLRFIYKLNKNNNSKPINLVSENNQNIIKYLRY